MSKLRLDFIVAGVLLFLAGSTSFFFHATACGLDLVSGSLSVSCLILNFIFGMANFAFVVVGTFLTVLGLASPFFKKGTSVGGFFRFLAKDALINGAFGVLLLPGTPEDAATGGVSIIVGLLYFGFKALQYFLI